MFQGSETFDFLLITIFGVLFAAIVISFILGGISMLVVLKLWGKAWGKKFVLIGGIGFIMGSYTLMRKLFAAVGSVSRGAAGEGLRQKSQEQKQTELDSTITTTSEPPKENDSRSQHHPKLPPKVAHHALMVYSPSAIYIEDMLRDLCVLASFVLALLTVLKSGRLQKKAVQKPLIR